MMLAIYTRNHILNLFLLLKAYLTCYLTFLYFSRLKIHGTNDFCEINHFLSLFGIEPKDGDIISP